MFEIVFAESVADDLRPLGAFDRRTIVDRIDEQLKHNPATVTRAKKTIMGLRPPWQFEEPIWQLRVGEFRVFYDVNQELELVLCQSQKFGLA
jgi:mRNA-degrading endonuclease RelE of RelBE toxin-antitoxin system